MSNLAVLFKRDFVILNEEKTAEEAESIIHDAMKLGRWVYMDSEGSKENILTQVKASEARFMN